MSKAKTLKPVKLSLIAITWPIFIEIMLHMLMGNADTLMLSYYSDHSVAAVGLSNQLLQIIIVMFGFIATGASVVVAQSLGASKVKQSSEVAVMAIAVNLGFGLLLSLILFLFGKTFLSWMNTPDELMDQAYSFLVIVGGFSFVQAVIMTIGAIIRSYGFTRDAMNVAIFMNVLNVLGNCLVIFGPFGFPVLGVQGVAISTTVSRFIGLVVILYLLNKRVPGQLPFKSLLTLPIQYLKDLLKIGLPAAGEHLAYSTSQIAITYFITLLGTDALTTKVYALNIMMFIFLFSVSIGEGTQIIVGRLIGSRENDKAYSTCLRSLKYAMAISFFMALIVALSAKNLLSIFTHDHAIIAAGAALLYVTVILEPGRSFNLVVISSLRAAGDAKFPVLMGVISMCGISVPLAYFLGITMEMGLLGIWIAFIVDEWLRGLLMLWRWRSRIWERKNVLDIQPGAAHT
ncbi:MATE family efflux transporter [Fictibacillus sp. KIGAM418]|uniref:MATE family efflux transporter n=1 Tax=Fictibacillus marinisediminis TaxID=2878389 RepID=A0A9X2BCN0_9BACL|nr:MATE family efflux transporter [Fictibacillus marinisediminis]MCK6256691.1 MATE family efflux transporter [Fictibacillus marinisediminis]